MIRKMLLSRCCAVWVLFLFPMLRIYSQTLDSFDPRPNNEVRGIAVQADGKIVIGGDFTTVGGLVRNRLARLNQDGTVDPTFSPSADDSVICLVMQPDGKIIVGGKFTSLCGLPRERIGRLNADGSLDTTFFCNVSGSVHSMLLQPDGKIVVGGWFHWINGQTRNCLARLNSDGTLDSTFTLQAYDIVNGLARQEDGKILVSGIFGIMRADANGVLDQTFKPSPNNSVGTVAIQSDGKILIGGGFSKVGGVAFPKIARLFPNGSVDTQFAPALGAADWVATIVTQTDGKILIGGGFTQLGNSSKYVARLNSNGSLDSAFPLSANLYVESIAIQPDGKVLVGGPFTQLCGTSNSYIGRLINNTPATNQLSVSGSTITWLRGGSSPEVLYTTFELQTPNSTNWVNLGTGTRISGGWKCEGLPLSAVGSIRARGFASSGAGYGSSSLNYFVEQVITLPPVITTSPAYRTNNAGTLASFLVEADGLGPITYQWYKDGVLLSEQNGMFGTRASTLVLSNVFGSDAGRYSVVVSNQGGSVTGLVSTLVVIDPVITEQPASQTKKAGESVGFAVSVVGTEPAGFRWIKDGVFLVDDSRITGAQTDRLSISNVLPSDAGIYTAIVTNAFGTNTTVGAELTVLDPPVFNEQLGSVTAAPNQDVAFTANVRGATPLSFQWLRYDVPLVDDGHISGSSSATLRVSKVTTSDTGYYSLVVSNVFGCVTSAPPPFLWVWDQFAPAISVTNYPNWFCVNTNRIRLQGLASDTDFGGSPVVSVTVNGLDALDGNESNSDVVNWEAKVVLTNKHNDISISASDILGNTATQSVHAVYDTNIPAVMALEVSGFATNYAFIWRALVQDDVLVDKVWLQANDSDWVEARLYEPGPIYFPTLKSVLVADGSTNYWSAPLQMVARTNVIRCVARDAAGNYSTTNTQMFDWKYEALQVEIDGRGTVTPNYEGASMELLKTYKITATPSSGFRFAGWTSNGDIASSEPTLSFVMRAGLVLTAHFVDVAKPTVTINRPVENARTRNPIITVSGTARDNVGVAQVSYRINNGALTSIAGPLTNWSFSVPLVPGPNKLFVQASDAAGNVSAPALQDVFYIVTNRLTLNVRGAGFVSPALNGQWLEIGRQYTITAQPLSSKSMFWKWTGDVASTQPTLTFVMRSNMTITANFVTNAFLARKGTYNGLFFEAGEKRMESSGAIKFNVTETGAFAGRLARGTESIPFSGRFDGEGRASFLLYQGTTAVLKTDMQIDLTNRTDTINFVVSSKSWTSDGQAVLTVPGESLPFSGQYWFGFWGGSGTLGPLESGWCAANNSKDGLVTFVGQLSDRTPFSGSSAISRQGTWPMYAAFGSGPGQGVILGWVAPEEVQANRVGLWILRR